MPPVILAAVVSFASDTLCPLAGATPGMRADVGLAAAGVVAGVRVSDGSVWTYSRQGIAVMELPIAARQLRDIQFDNGDLTIGVDVESPWPLMGVIRDLPGSSTSIRLWTAHGGWLVPSEGAFLVLGYETAFRVGLPAGEMISVSLPGHVQAVGGSHVVDGYVLFGNMHTGGPESLSAVLTYVDRSFARLDLITYQFQGLSTRLTAARVSPEGLVAIGGEARSDGPFIAVLSRSGDVVWEVPLAQSVVALTWDDEAVIVGTTGDRGSEIQRYGEAGELEGVHLLPRVRVSNITVDRHAILIVGNNEGPRGRRGPAVARLMPDGSIECLSSP